MGQPLLQLLDYELQVKARICRQVKNGKSNCQKEMCCNLFLADGSKISARPSGTEPKIKFYFSVNARLSTAGEFETVHEALNERIKGIISDMKLK